MRTGQANLPVAMTRPGADSLDRMGILRSWRLSSWLSRWARWREQPWESYRTQVQEPSARDTTRRPPGPMLPSAQRKEIWPKGDPSHSLAVPTLPQVDVIV